MAPLLNGIGIVVSDMARSFDFYRRLGLDVPETPHEGHVDIALPNQWRLMLDSEDKMRKFMPDWIRRPGNLFSLAFQCESPAEVDKVYAEMAKLELSCVAQLMAQPVHRLPTVRPCRGASM